MSKVPATEILPREIISDKEWQEAKPRLAMFSALVQSGIPPAQAVAESGMALHDSKIEIYLEKIMYDRILHPDGRILSDFVDPDDRRPGDISRHEVYLLTDLLHYSRSYPLTYIASTLNVDTRIISKVKKEIAEHHYRMIKDHTAETFVGDYMRRAEQLTSRVHYNEGKAPVGSQNRLSFQKFQFEILNKLLDRQQELGKIPKNLGTAHIKEEYVVEVRSGGVISNQRKELPANSDDTDIIEVIDIEPGHYTSAPDSTKSSDKDATVSNIVPVAREVGASGILASEPSSQPHESNSQGDGGPISFVTAEQMERIRSVTQNNSVPSDEEVNRKIKKIASTEDGAAFLAQKARELGTKARISIDIQPPEDER